MVTRVKSDIYLHENVPYVENVLYIMKYLSEKPELLQKQHFVAVPKHFSLKTV